MTESTLVQEDEGLLLVLVLSCDLGCSTFCLLMVLLLPWWKVKMGVPCNTVYSIQPPICENYTGADQPGSPTPHWLRYWSLFIVSPSFALIDIYLISLSLFKVWEKL